MATATRQLPRRPKDWFPRKDEVAKRSEMLTNANRQGIDQHATKRRDLRTLQGEDDNTALRSRLLTKVDIGGTGAA
jgi:hypothetical protein